jgi:hypothetical protein
LASREKHADLIGDYLLDAFSNFQHSFIYISLGAAAALLDYSKQKRKQVEINQVGHPLHIIIPPPGKTTTQVKKKEKKTKGGGSKENIYFFFSRVNDFLLFISNKQKKENIINSSRRENISKKECFSL